MNQLTTIGTNISGATRDDQMVALWLSGRPETTTRAYAYEALRFYRHVQKPLARVTATDLYAYAESLARAGLKPASQYRALSAIKSLFGHAHRLGYIQANPAVALRMPQPQHDRASKLLSVEAVNAIIDSTRTERDRLICRTLYICGLRESELCNLNAGDVHDSALYIRGKGGKSRTIAIPLELVAELKAQSRDEGPLFQSINGKRLSPSDIYRLVRKAGEDAGYHLTPHMLRHAHASHALDNGAPLHVVRDTLGHASLGTTSVYSHAKPCDGSAMYLGAIIQPT